MRKPGRRIPSGESTPAHELHPEPAQAEAYAEFLSQVGLFAGLDPVARARVAGSLERVSVTDGTSVVRQGDPPDGVYVVHEGRFSVYGSAPGTGAEIWLSSCARGDTFGEIGLLTGEPRTATVRADGDGEVLRLDQNRFREFVQRDPSVALAVAAQLIRQLRAADAARSRSDGLRSGTPDGAEAVVPSNGTTHESPARLSVHGRLRGQRAGSSQGIAVALAVLIVAGSWIIAPPAGLGPAGWRVLLAVVASVPLFATGAIPDSAVGLFLVGAWVLGSNVTLPTALSGFTSSTWLLTLAILAIASAVAATGMVFRLALWAATHTRGGFAGETTALVLSGLAISTAFPETTARTALVAFATGDLAEALGYLPGAPASVGIAMAVFVGFGQTAAPFLTSSSTALLTYTLLPEAARVGLDWTTWALRAGLFYLVLLVGLTACMLWLYRPTGSDAIKSGNLQARHARVALQRALLGRPSSRERAAGVVVLLLIGAFVTGPIHHIEPAYVALAALLVLSVVGVVTTESIRSINWNLLVLFGAVASAQAVFDSTGVNQWLAAVLVGPLQPLASVPWLFLTAVAALCVGISFLVRMPTAAPLVTLALGPVAFAAGIDPWTVAFLALVACSNFIFAYQSNPYQALLHGISGHHFTDGQTRPLAVAYVVLTFIALYASVPVWHLMGLL